jgi:hypothetical protein
VSEQLYLEAHVTISPVHDEEREKAAAIARAHGFKLAHLVMLKRGPDVPSQRDTFMTSHGKNIDDLAARTKQVVQQLRTYGFKVWRYKIESCVLDSRQQGDTWGVLDPDRPPQPLIACDGCSARSA